MQTILLVEDNREELEELRIFLGCRFPGIGILTAESQALAVRDYSKSAIDVVITDMRMEQTLAGLDVLLKFKKSYPGTHVIVYTGAVREIPMAVLCVRSGCFDYIEKPNVERLSSAVRMALDLANPVMDRDSLAERLLLADWHLLQSAESRERKGTALEGLCSTLFATIPGWQRIETRVKSKTEEIDLVVLNESPDEFWRRFGTVVLIECKNWSRRKPPGRPEFDCFYQKITRRGGADCRLGFFVSLNGVARTFELELERLSKESIVIVPIDVRSLWELISTSHRSDRLKRLVAARLVG